MPVYYEIGDVQDHWAIDKVGRDSLEVRLPDLVKSASNSEYQKHPEFAKEQEEKDSKKKKKKKSKSK